MQNLDTTHNPYAPPLFTGVLARNPAATGRQEPRR